MFRFFKHFSFNELSKHNSRKFNCNVPSDQKWDIIISGGGMVGCAMACALGNSAILDERKILLLESSRATNYAVDSHQYSNRVSAISPGSKSFFQSFNAWEKITRFKEVKKMQVWESCSDARITFQNLGMIDNIAYIIENNDILKALNEKLQDLSHKVKILRGSIASKYHFPPGKDPKNEDVVVELQDGQTLHTKLLIGSDGANSTVRQSMGVKYVKWNYNQKAIVATLKLSEPTSNIVAWQRFLPSGPIALLPLTDELCSLVWTVSLPMAEKLHNLSDEEFVDTLNSHLWDNKYKNALAEAAVSGLRDILHSFGSGRENVHQLPPSILSVESNSRAEFPLGLGHATEYVRPQVALIGDAAHKIHPLAGQGVNLGFGDVECLVNCLETSIYNGNVIGCMEPLLEYETQRQRHVVPIMTAIDALNRVYKTEFVPILLLRGLGLTMVDSFAPIKTQLIKLASVQ